MITKQQLKELSSEFGVDRTTIFREYLQLLFLHYLYKEKVSEKIYFKGGTCLHFLYRSPRFSEDLDFSTILSRQQIKKLLERIIDNLQKEISNLSLVFIYSGKKALRYKIEYQGDEFKYPLTIRIDFVFEKIFLKPLIAKIETKFPITFFSLISSLKEEEILAEKVRAFLIRAKGRDIFDLWYLFSKNLSLKQGLLEEKLKRVDRKFNQKRFLEAIKKYPLKKLELGLARFLPRPYRKIIPNLKKELLAKLEEQ